MRRLALTLSVLILVAGVLGFRAAEQVSAGEGGDWLTSWEEAAAASKKSGKPILADFTGSDWCGWCIKLREEVFDTEAFKKWAVENVVLLELDFPRRKAQSEELKKQNAELRDKFGIRGYPTILFLDTDGKELGRSGYKRGGPDAWIAHAETQIKKSDG